MCLRSEILFELDLKISTSVKQGELERWRAVGKICVSKDKNLHIALNLELR